MQDILIRIIQGILCIGFVLTIHELGHLIAARIVGVRVQKFSVFLSPFFAIIRWKPGKYIKFFVTKKEAEDLIQKNSNDDLEDFENIKPKSWKDTEYVLGWLPIAGYCKFDTQFSRQESEDGPVIYPKWDIRSFHAIKRLFVTLSGIIFNLICAACIFFCLDFFAPPKNLHEKEVTTSLVQYSPYANKIGLRNDDYIIKADSIDIRDAMVDLNKILTAKSLKVLRSNDTITITLPPSFRDSIIEETQNKLFNYYFVYYSQTPLVKEIASNSVSDSLGIKRGDFIIKIDTLNIQSTSFLFYNSENRIDSLISLTIARRNLSNDWDIFEHSFVLPSKYPIAGMTLALDKTDYFNILQEVEDSLRNKHSSTATAVSATSMIATDMAKSYVSSEEDKDDGNDDGGGIIGIIKVFPNQWDWPFWWYAVAIFSIGVAIFNLLPIPGLDGGQAIFCLLEIILRRKLNENVLGWINGISWLLLLGWIIWVNIKGLINLF